MTNHNRCLTYCYTGLPTYRDRKKIISRLLYGIEHDLSSQGFNQLSLLTEGFSGSDLESVTREAVNAPIRECLRSAAIMKMKSRKQVIKYKAKSRNSNNDEGVDQENENEITRNVLLNRFRNLRPVSIQDFEEAISFWIGDGQEQMCLKSLNRSGAYHYDSESSESTTEHTS